MAVRLRLARIGKHKSPFYRIVAIDSRKARDSKPLEIIGTYDAIKSNMVNFNNDSFSKWISNGAQMSESVRKLVKLAKKQLSQ